MNVRHGDSGPEPGEETMDDVPAGDISLIEASRRWPLLAPVFVGAIILAFFRRSFNTRGIVAIALLLSIANTSILIWQLLPDTESRSRPPSLQPYSPSRFDSFERDSQRQYTDQRIRDLEWDMQMQLDSLRMKERNRDLLGR
jgi:hypothetical protein